MSDPIILFGPSFSTFVRSAAIVCEEKGVAYEIRDSIDGRPIQRGSPELRKLHPFSKVPVMLHGKRKLAETAPICRYLDTTFGPETLQGSDSWSRAQCDQWCQLISIYVDRYVVRDFMLELAFPSGSDGKPLLEKVEAGRAKAEEAVGVVAEQLGDKPFLLGDEFTLADAILVPILDYQTKLPASFNLIAKYENLSAYTERLQRRESCRKVLSK